MSRRGPAAVAAPAPADADVEASPPLRCAASDLASAAAASRHCRSAVRACRTASLTVL